MGYFTGKVAVITGAGSGIGRELSLQLALQGCNLAISDVNEAGLQETVSLLANKDRIKVDADLLNVGDREAFIAYAVRIAEEFGKVDAVFNNAGISNRADWADEMSYEEYQRVIDINLWGVIYGSREFIPHLLNNPGSHLVNISSIFGLIAPPKVAVYCATKFAVRGFTESLITELEPQNVKVTCVHPGVIATNIAAAADAPREQVDAFAELGMTPAECARQILEATRKGKRRVVITRGAKILDWVQRLTPAGYRRVMLPLLRLGDIGKRDG